jgi:hypothetical protein
MHIKPLALLLVVEKQLKTFVPTSYETKHSNKILGIRQNIQDLISTRPEKYWSP